MHSFGLERVPDRPGDHDWNWLTYCCKRCGATATAVHEGTRPEQCEPGVVGITHRAKAARLQALVNGPSTTIPLMRLSDFGRPPEHVNCRSAITGRMADLLIVDDPYADPAA